MKTDKHKCGCGSERERERWVSLCAPHKAESDEVRARWARDRAKVESSIESVPASTAS